MCVLIVLVASIGKFGGSALAARLTGLKWRDSAALGILMNTRGLVELIVLNIGLDFGVIAPELFAMLVIMALVTTFATTPILRLLITGESRREFEEQPASPAGTRVSLAAAKRLSDCPVVAAVSNPHTVDTSIELAAAASPVEGHPLRVLTLIRRPEGGVRSGLREIEERVAPKTPVLLAVMERARSLGVPIETQAAWSDDPGRDLVEMAQAAGAARLMIGVHQPVFGTDEMGGMVRQVMSNLAGSSITWESFREAIFSTRAASSPWWMTSLMVVRLSTSPRASRAREITACMRFWLPTTARNLPPSLRPW